MNDKRRIPCRCDDIVVCKAISTLDINGAVGGEHQAERISYRVLLVTTNVCYYYHYSSKINGNILELCSFIPSYRVRCDVMCETNAGDVTCRRC